MPAVAATKTVTPLQRKLVATVADLIAERGYPPSLREIADRMGHHFTASRRLAHIAVSHGLLCHTPGVYRSWRPATTSPSAKPSSRSTRKPGKRSA